MTTVIEFYVADKDRKKTVKQLEEHFEHNYSVQIEKGLYDYTEQFCNSNNNHMIMAPAIYKDCSQNILYNFEQNHATVKELKKLIDKKKYNPYNLAYLRPEELDKDNWKKIISRKDTTEKTLKNRPTIDWKPCRVCKNTKYEFYQLQTRSADEPMTTFYNCIQCDKTYKVNN